MLNLASLIIGVVALIFAVVAFLPLLGWANWFIIPLAVIGAAVGMRRSLPSAARSGSGKDVSSRA